MFQSDWTKTYQDYKALEKDLYRKNNPFKYDGQGWYLTETDTLFCLVHDDERITVYCWNIPNAQTQLLMLIASPVRTLAK